jgi:pimeloyl-ACP methyl ester carboxylesterase
MLLARAAQQAYLAQPRLDDYVPHLIRKGPVEAVVFVGKDNLIVAFRGTEALKVEDWWVDLKVRKKRLSNAPGKWHRGFVDALWRVQLHIEVKIGFSNRIKPIYITGHSLGGALAVVHAAELAVRGEDDRVREVVTFGAPRVANLSAKRWLESKYQHKIVQYKMPGDKVPHLPPAWLGYVHVNHSKQMTYVPAEHRWYHKLQMFSRGLLNTHRHSMGAYMAALAEMQR